MGRVGNFTKERNIMEQAKIYIRSQSPKFNCKNPQFLSHLRFLNVGFSNMLGRLLQYDFLGYSDYIFQNQFHFIPFAFPL